MIGKLQTKVKPAVQLFDFIHSVDSEKLAKNCRWTKNKTKIKIFLQVNMVMKIKNQELIKMI